MVSRILQQRLSIAWKAIHSGLPMLVTGGIAPGNSGEKGIAWKALPWSSHHSKVETTVPWVFNFQSFKNKSSLGSNPNSCSMFSYSSLKDNLL